MKRLLLSHPELTGAAIGLLDALPRAVAAYAYAPSKATLQGWVLIGNVHHVNGARAFGLDTFAWFGIGAGILALLYAALRAGGHVFGIDNVAFTIARALFGTIAGILLLNVAEAAITGKVTNYVGLALGSRFFAVNGGDVLLWLCLSALMPMAAGAVALHLTSRTSPA